MKKESSLFWNYQKTFFKLIARGRFIFICFRLRKTQVMSTRFLKIKSNWTDIFQLPRKYSNAENLKLSIEHKIYWFFLLLALKAPRQEEKFPSNIKLRYWLQNFYWVPSFGKENQKKSSEHVWNTWKEEMKAVDLKCQKSSFEWGESNFCILTFFSLSELSALL